MKHEIVNLTTPEFLEYQKKVKQYRELGSELDILSSLVRGQLKAEAKRLNKIERKNATTNGIYRYFFVQDSWEMKFQAFRLCVSYAVKGMAGKFYTKEQAERAKVKRLKDMKKKKMKENKPEEKFRREMTTLLRKYDLIGRASVVYDRD